MGNANSPRRRLCAHSLEIAMRCHPALRWGASYHHARPGGLAAGIEHLVGATQGHAVGLHHGRQHLLPALTHSP